MLFARCILRNASRLSIVWVLLQAVVFAQHTALRDPKAPCGLYFTDAHKTQGTRLSSLDPEEMSKALEDISAEQMSKHLALVGVEPRDLVGVRTSLKLTLANLGHKKVDVTVIRRLSSFIAEETGFFYLDPQGQWQRLSSTDPQAIKEALAEKNIDPNSSFLSVGTPLLGSIRRETKAVLAERGIQNARLVSPWQAYLTKAMQKPVGAVQHAARSLSFFFPIREDFVRPSSAELQGAVQKILIPGIITFTVMLSQDQPLEVLIPVTLINAANSFATATFRSFLGNWWRRSTSFFPSQWLKNVMVTSFFTANLYWAGRLQKLPEILTFAGWTNFVTSKWITVLFNTLWRAPVSNAIYSWEHRKSRDADPATSLHVRRAGAAMEKYLSYIMTQFYIYSIITQSSLFSIVQYQNGSLGFGYESEGVSSLMNFNIGHAAMASVGALAFVAMKNTKIMELLSGWAIHLDTFENRVVDVLFEPWRWMWRQFHKPSSN